jgi:hypothetical protein
VVEVKKTHLLLLAIAAVLALSSAYSLAAINQVYNINFEWYSQYNRAYEAIKRDISKDRFAMASTKLKVELGVIENAATLQHIRQENPYVYKSVIDAGTKDNIFIYCSLGMVDSPEYRIRISSIAQRGSSVEIKVSINTPDSSENNESGFPTANGGYSPTDVVKVSKDTLPSKGKIYFVFKDQNGRQLYEEYCYVW